MANYEITADEKVICLYDDKEAAEKFCLKSAEVAAAIRREMKLIPRFAKGVVNYGQGVIPEVMRDYILQRGTQENKKDLARARKMKG